MIDNHDLILYEFHFYKWTLLIRESLGLNLFQRVE